MRGIKVGRKDYHDIMWANGCKDNIIFLSLIRSLIIVFHPGFIKCIYENIILSSRMAYHPHVILLPA